jgi:hypothetical protein
LTTEFDPTHQGHEKASARVGFLSDATFRIWAVSIALVSLTFGLQSYYPSLIGPLSNVFPAAGASAAFTSSLLCWKRYGFGLRRRFEAVWFFFSLGTGLWILAELTWASYYFILNVEVPYPSVADFFYIGGYLPMIAGLVLYLGAFSVAMSRKRLAVALASIAAAVTVAMGMVVPSELSQGLSALNIMTDLAYPILDLVLFSLTILCLAIFVGGRISKWWYLFGGASLLYVIGDEYFLYQVAAGNYYNGSIDDLFFILGYLTFALAFYAHRREF